MIYCRVCKCWEL